jgi:hypothetical protein
MQNITVIIPLIDLSTQENLVLFQKCLSSIPQGMQVICVGAKEVIDLIPENSDINITKIVSTGDNTIPSHVNLGVENVTTKYFSVVEIDDVFSKNWFNGSQEYISKMGDDVICYLPLTEIIDFNSSDILGYANEAFWASSFSEEIGFIDNTSLQDYLNINTNCGVFDTEMFKESGKLKSSMKILYWYEFLLRVTYKGKKVFIIPKVGCFHNVNRPGANDVRSKMSEKEFEWWLDLANKEYFFQNDRNKTYDENN